MKRSINQIIKARKVRMGDIELYQPLPHPLVDQLDPYLLIHHWAQDYPGGQRQRDVGVGPHPHRGFAPITFIFEGGLQHRDSLGNNSIIYGGGTQWTNTGKGITHSERPTKQLAEDGGTLELIQFWLNTPAKHKMEPAQYLPLTEEATPTSMSSDGKSKIQVVSGQYHEVNGGIQAQSPVLILRLDMKKGGKLTLPVPKDYNALLYQLDGLINADDKMVGARTMIVYNNDADSIEIEALENTRAILLSGQPLNEPVAAQGPFVMNQDIEIMQAMRDYQMGKMGILIEEFE